MNITDTGRITMIPGSIYQNERADDLGVSGESFINDITFILCDFGSEHLSGITFNQCVFENCSFKDIGAFDSHFYDCEFKDCDFSESMLADVAMEDCTLERCDFSQLFSVHSFTFTKCKMTQCLFMEFEGDKSGMEFTKCGMTCCTFQGFLLHSVEFDECRFWAVKWDSLNIEKTEFSQCVFALCQFLKVEFDQMIFNSGTLQDVKFQGCTLTKTVKMRGVIFCDTKLVGTKFPPEITDGITIAPYRSGWVAVGAHTEMKVGREPTRDAVPKPPASAVGAYAGFQGLPSLPAIRGPVRHIPAKDPDEPKTGKYRAYVFLTSGV